MFDIHSPRLFGLAIIDLLGTLLITWIILRFFGINDFKTQVKFYIMSIYLGIFIHYLTGVDSFLSKNLFSKEINLFKIIFIFLSFILLS